MKAIVQTQDKSVRIVPTTGETIEAFRPSVVTVTEFINTLVMQTKLKPLAVDLPDTATDSDFKKFYNESKGKDGKFNIDLAIEAFKVKLNVNAEDKLSADDAADKAAKEASDKAAKEASDKAAKEAANKAGGK